MIYWCYEMNGGKGGWAEPTCDHDNCWALGTEIFVKNGGKNE